MTFPTPVFAHGGVDDGDNGLATPSATLSAPLNENLFYEKEKEVIANRQAENNRPPLLLIIVGLLVIAGVTATILADRGVKRT
ncbi:MAG: hypothetical protein Q8R11_03950 [bacterium]|nr:hypothetical protein [bacterium]